MPLPLEITATPQDRVLRQLVAAALFEGLVPFRIEPGDMLVFTLEGQEYRCKASLGTFSRPRILPHSVEVKTGDNDWAPPSLDVIVAGLPGNDVTRSKLLGELKHTTTLCQWNEDNIPSRNRRDMGFAQLDGAMHEGHPYHPCFKARFGFTTADNQRFGPETAEPFQLFWALHERTDLRKQLDLDEADFWQRELGTETWGQIDAARREKGLDW